MSREQQRRKLRAERFGTKQSGTSAPLSATLVQCAYHLLIGSVNERKGHVWQGSQNHTADFAPGLVVMVVAAFDAWLNEMIGFHRHTGLSEQRAVELVNKRSCDKYREVAKLSDREVVVPDDLELLIAVRNEIVHYLPYTQILTESTVPVWLAELEEKNLLIRTADPSTGDFLFSQLDFVHF